jgi:hypothetical protein
MNDHSPRQNFKMNSAQILFGDSLDNSTESIAPTTIRIVAVNDRSHEIISEITELMALRKLQAGIP